MIYNCPMVLVLNNAPVHSNIKRIFLGNEFKINKILSLGPYSPILNPMSAINASVKRNQRENIRATLTEENLYGISKAEYHIRKEIEFIEDGIQGPVSATCKACPTC